MQGHEPLLDANLVRVFGERNRDRRQAAIAELYAPDAVLYEPDATVRANSFDELQWNFAAGIADRAETREKSLFRRVFAPRCALLHSVLC